MSAESKSPFSVLNVRLFIAFRVLFNSRFYYPIFTVLFLDFGLSLEQFLILNAIWGISIVLLEVPSGALADVVGRKQLVVYAGILMVIEMALLAFAPIGGGAVLFWVMVINRILSGAAEAAASGADEALAYDSLEKEGLQEGWPRVLERTMQFQSVGMVLAMLIGPFLYDAVVLQQTLAAVGFEASISKELSMRLPLFLGLATAVLTLLIALRMRNVQSDEEAKAKRNAGKTGRAAVLKTALAEGTRTTLEAGWWIVRSRVALILIVAGFLFDSVVRTFVTLNSEYYRIIGLPEASFGLVASAMAMMGIALPILGRWLAEKRSATFNFFLLFALTLVGLFGVAQAWSWWGLIPVVPLFATMSLVSFLLSFYINRLTSSKQRATVLSFRGLAFNLAYAGASGAYALMTFWLRGRAEARPGELSEAELQDTVFVEALGWLPWIFLTLAAGYLVFSRVALRGDSTVSLTRRLKSQDV